MIAVLPRGRSNLFLFWAIDKIGYAGVFLAHNRESPDVSDKIGKARVFLGQNLSRCFDVRKSSVTSDSTSENLFFLLSAVRMAASDTPPYFCFSYI